MWKEVIHALVHNDNKMFDGNQDVVYRRSKVIKCYQSAVKQSKQVGDNVNNQFIPVNRFQPLVVSHIHNHVNRNCQYVVRDICFCEIWERKLTFQKECFS